MEIAHSVLAPTLMVRSGYGLHAYWLFHDRGCSRTTSSAPRPNGLCGAGKRDCGKRRKEFGMTKFDSTHDLARVFRVPGSMNGKADAPAPVRLLDDGGPRYTIEQIAAEAVEIESRADTDSRRSR